MKLFPVSGIGVLITVAFLFVAPCKAQGVKQALPSISPAIHDGLIREVIQKLNERYVFPDIARKMEEALHRRQREGTYARLTNGTALAEALTADLQAVSNDKHLRITYSSVSPAPITVKESKPADSAEAHRRAGAQENWGFERVEVLPGNVGYLDLRLFHDPQYAGEKAAAAMAFLADTDALIIDVRQNGGGYPGMVALLCSYLLPPEPVHLTDFYDRPSDKTWQSWSLPYVTGQRYLDRPVYILTSRRTFSGAEEFCYVLKHLKRATLVGEVTGGGAHPGDSIPLSAGFEVFVPTGRPINPRTGSNWEGKGVAPDMDMPAIGALPAAHTVALKKLLEQTKDKQRQEALQKALEGVRKAP